MAVLAAIALGVTVSSRSARSPTRRTSSCAARPVRWSLRSSPISRRSTSGPPTNATLERELASHSAKGLRYVALIERDGRAFAEAGTATMPAPCCARRDRRVVERRVRVASMLPPPRRVPGQPPAHFGPVLPRRRARAAGDRAAPRPPHAHLGRRRRGAALVLLAFAIAWSRSASRLAAIERRAAREQRLVALGSDVVGDGPRAAQPARVAQGSRAAARRGSRRREAAQEGRARRRRCRAARGAHDEPPRLRARRADRARAASPRAPSSTRALEDLDATRVDVRRATASSMPTTRASRARCTT